MQYLDTPDERFETLPDFPYAPRFVEVDPVGLRMGYVDEGPSDAPVVLLLHGEPSWSFLYRGMVRRIAEAGLRAVAPDLVGFGRSSKPTAVEDYTYARHVGWVRAFLEALDLSDVTLFGQDWGSLIGLRLAAELEPRFARVAIGNGFLPTGEAPGGRRLRFVVPGLAFLAWRTFAKRSPVFVASRIVATGTARSLSKAERAAYDAPFPDARYLAGARAFPQLVPVSKRDPAREDNLAAWRVLERWDKPFLTLFSNGDPITRGLDRELRRRIPGARGQPHATVTGGHFLQEDASPELARRLIDFARA